MNNPINKMRIRVTGDRVTPNDKRYIHRAKNRAKLTRDAKHNKDTRYTVQRVQRYIKHEKHEIKAPQMNDCETSENVIENEATATTDAGRNF